MTVNITISTSASKNGGADMTYAWSDAVISPMPCDVAVDIFWHDRIKTEADIPVLAEEYAASVANAITAAKEGAVDAVIAPEDTRGTIIAALKMLSGKRASRMPKKHGNLPL